MTNQNLILEKCWKPLQAALNQKYVIQIDMYVLKSEGDRA